MVLNIASYTIGNYFIEQNQIKTPVNEIDFNEIINKAISRNDTFSMDKINSPQISLNPVINTQITELSNNTGISFIDNMLEQQVDILKQNGIKITGTSEEIADEFQEIAENNNIGITDLMSAIIYSRAMFMQGNNKNTDYITYLTNIIKTENYPR